MIRTRLIEYQMSKGSNASLKCYNRQRTRRTSNYTARNRQGAQIASKHKRRQSYILQILTPPEYILRINGMERAFLTMDVLRGNLSFQVRSPLCIAHQCQVPSEPHQLENPDDARNGWPVFADSLPLAGQARERDEPMVQEG